MEEEAYKHACEHRPESYQWLMDKIASYVWEGAKVWSTRTIEMPLEMHNPMFPLFIVGNVGMLGISIPLLVRLMRELELKNNEIAKELKLLNSPVKLSKNISALKNAEWIDSEHSFGGEVTS